MEQTTVLAEPLPEQGNQSFPNTGLRSSKQIRDQKVQLQANDKQEAFLPVDIDSFPIVQEIHAPETIWPHWLAYLDMLKKKEEMALLGMLSTRELKTEYPHSVILQYSSPFDESLLLKAKENMTLFLRQLTRLNQLEIRLLFVEELPETNFRYTPADKFEVLVNKNPVLEILRQRLQMDFDY